MQNQTGFFEKRMPLISAGFPSFCKAQHVNQLDVQAHRMRYRVGQIFRARQEFKHLAKTMRQQMLLLFYSRDAFCFLDLLALFGIPRKD